MQNYVQRHNGEKKETFMCESTCQSSSILQTSVVVSSVKMLEIYKIVKITGPIIYNHECNPIIEIGLKLGHPACCFQCHGGVDLAEI